MPNDDTQPNLSRQALRQAEIARSIVDDIELSKAPLAQTALKASRLARLLEDRDHHQIFKYEAGGYPSGNLGIQPEVFELGRKAGRVNSETDKSGIASEKMSVQSIEAIQSEIETAKVQLAAAQDAPFSFSSANPQLLMTPTPSKNQTERDLASLKIGRLSDVLARRRAFIYDYALERLIELSFSGIVSDAFSRVRSKTDEQLGSLAPDALSKLSAVYKNLESESAEDWANAVHGCRRILQSLADRLFPAKEPESRRGKTILLGPDNYINRLVCFIDDHSNSKNHKETASTHLRFMGERLDAVFSAANKGTHSEITTREEADRYVIYTYMLVHDIISLVD